MSALAKVFVVIVLILAVGFTGTTATLYTAREDWNKALKASIDDNKNNVAEWTRVKGELDGIIKQNNSNIADYQNKMTQLTAERDGLKTQVDGLSSDLAAKEKDLRNALDANRLQDQHLSEKDAEIARLSKNSDELRTRTQKAEESEKAALLAASRRDLDNEQLSKALDDIRIEFASLKKDNDDNLSALTRLKEMAPDWADRILIAKPAPPIDGVVLAVHPETKIAVLSVGANEKVESGYSFVAYRGDRYIGKLQTTKVAPDMCGAKILYLEEGQQLKTGDSVTTRIAP